MLQFLQLSLLSMIWIFLHLCSCFLCVSVPKQRSKLSLCSSFISSLSSMLLPEASRGTRRWDEVQIGQKQTSLHLQEGLMFVLSPRAPSSGPLPAEHLRRFGPVIIDWSQHASWHQHNTVWARRSARGAPGPGRRRRKICLTFYCHTLRGLRLVVFLWEELHNPLSICSLWNIQFTPPLLTSLLKHTQPNHFVSALKTHFSFKSFCFVKMLFYAASCCTTKRPKSSQSHVYYQFYL